MRWNATDRFRCLVGLLVLFGPACSGAAHEEREARAKAPTVVVLAVDDLRADRLAFLQPEQKGGGPLASTPFLAGRVAGATSYLDYVTPSTSSSAAAASLLTGQHPSEHGLESVREPGRHRLHSRVPRLAEAFREAGWETLALVTARQFSGHLSGFDRGFASYLDAALDTGGRPMPLRERLGLVREELEPALSRTVPLFLFVQAGDLREGAPAPEETAGILRERLQGFVGEIPELEKAFASADVSRAVAGVLARRRGSPVWEVWQRALYDARLRALDDGLAELFELVEARRNPALVSFVIVGTRGRYLLEPRPDSPSEGFSEGLLRTPLFVSLRGLGAGERSGLCSAALVAPTLARAFELDTPLAARPALEDGALPDLLVLSPRTGEKALCGADLVLGTPVPHGGMLRIRGDGRTLVVRDPRGSLLEPASAEGHVRITRDRRQAEVALPRNASATLYMGQLAGPLAIEVEASASASASARGSESAGEGRGFERVYLEGGGEVGGLPVPRIPAKRSEAWEVPEGEALPWKVDVVDAGGGWVRVSVLGETQDVRVYCALYPPDEDLTEGLEVRLTEGVDRLTPRSLPGAVCLGGRTPFEAELKLAGRRPALAVSIGGRFCPTGEMRYLGRRFDGETPALYLPFWLPQRLDWFLDPVRPDQLGSEPERRGAGSGSERGTIWLGRGLAPSEGPWDLTSEEVRFLQRLKSE